MSQELMKKLLQERFPILKNNGSLVEFVPVDNTFVLNTKTIQEPLASEIQNFFRAKMEEIANIK